jgi:DNA-binding HxlR family transcriptional regulator
MAKQQFEDINLITLPQKMFFPYRILIMKILSKESEIYFQDLKHKLNLTEGNLVSHLRALEAEGLTSFRKEVNRKRVRTINCITPKGKRLYKEFCESMIEVLK